MAAYRLGGILDSVAKEKGCVAKPATELCLHGKHNAEGKLVRGMALRMLLESVLRNPQALRGDLHLSPQGLAAALRRGQAYVQILIFQEQCVEPFLGHLRAALPNPFNILHENAWMISNDLRMERVGGDLLARVAHLPVHDYSILPWGLRTTSMRSPGAYCPKNTCAGHPQRR